MVCRVLEDCSSELQRAMSEVEHKEHVRTRLGLLLVSIKSLTATIT